MLQFVVNIVVAVAAVESLVEVEVVFSEGELASAEDNVRASLAVVATVAAGVGLLPAMVTAVAAELPSPPLTISLTAGGRSEAEVVELLSL